MFWIKKQIHLILLKCTLDLLYDTFAVKTKLNHLVVVRDGAMIRILLHIKREYGQTMDWVIPFIEDWHVLKNFQEVLMKTYWDTGLKDVAKIIIIVDVIIC